MNTSYGTPSTWRMRPPSDSPKTRMKSSEERIGATTVCVHSFEHAVRLALAQREQAPVAGGERGDHDAIALT